MRHRQRAGLVRRGGELGSGLEVPEEVRLLEDHARRVACRLGELLGIGDPVAVRHLDDLEPEARREGLHDLAHLRVRRLGDDDLRTARHVLRDVAGVRGHGRAVVAGCVRDVHPGQLADRRLVLEDRLEHALAHLRLVRRVRGQELAALEHGVDDRGHVVVVDPRAEERDLVAHVACGELFEVRDHLGLGERGVERELAPEAHALGDVAEELVDRRDADRVEHLALVALGQRDERRHCSARNARYAPASRSSSASAGSLSRIRISQPSP